MTVCSMFHTGWTESLLLKFNTDLMDMEDSIDFTSAVSAKFG